MAITTRAFGTTQDGQNVTMYTLTNHSGASVSMLDLGAIVTNILVPDKNGKLADVALGFDTLAHYEGGHGAMGDTSGASRTASAAAASPLTARNITSTRTTAKTPCTAAKSASRRRSGRRRPSRGIRWIPSSSITFPRTWRRTSPAI